MDPVPSDPVPIDPDVAETAVPDPTPTIPDPTLTNPLDDGGRLEANEPDPVPDAEVDATLARARSVEGADAVDAFREAIASLEEGDPRRIDAQMDLGRLLTEMGRAHEARPLLRRALADVPAEDATRRARVMVAAAENLVAVTRYEDADSLYARATRIFDRELGSDHRETSAARAALAHLRGEK
jgi:tetratricopeptide (TPR) repeat protein